MEGWWYTINYRFYKNVSVSVKWNEDNPINVWRDNTLCIREGAPLELHSAEKHWWWKLGFLIIPQIIINLDKIGTNYENCWQLHKWMFSSSCIWYMYSFYEINSSEVWQIHSPITDKCRKWLIFGKVFWY